MSTTERGKAMRKDEDLTPEQEARIQKIADRLNDALDFIYRFTMPACGVLTTVIFAFFLLDAGGAGARPYVWALMALDLAILAVHFWMRSSGLVALLLVPFIAASLWFAWHWAVR